MEIAILEIIAKTGAYGLVIAVLFYYSISNYKINIHQKRDLDKRFLDLQTDYLDFKDKIINQLIELQKETNKAISELTIEISEMHKKKNK